MEKFSKTTWISLITIVMFFILPVSAISDEQEDKKPNKKKFGIVPLPIIAYAPETSLMFGLKGIFYHNQNPEEENSLQDSIQVGGVYTLNEQFMGMIQTEFYPYHKKIKVSMFLGFNKSPEMFFGIGDDYNEDDSENYLKEDIHYTAFCGFELTRGLYAGPAFDLWYMDVKDTRSGGMLDTLDNSGANGMLAFGAGIKVVLDTRNGTFYPLSGFLTEINLMRYDIESSFLHFSLDHRHYFNLYREHVLAFQITYTINVGRVPFQLMSSLGGESMLRGYYKGSYLDNCSIAAQIEYRLPVIWRIEVAFFFAAGNVGPGAFSFDPVKTAFAGGLGLRIMIDKKEKIPIRFDVAVNREGIFSYYLSILQAF